MFKLRCAALLIIVSIFGICCEEVLQLEEFYKFEGYKDEYLGCFRDSQGDLFKGHQENVPLLSPPEKCFRICALKNFPFAGLKSRTLCLCDKKQPSNNLLIGDSWCNSTCNGNTNRKCGGDESLSVYHVVPPDLLLEAFLGCYGDNDNKLLSGFFEEYPPQSAEHSAEQCQLTCSNLRYRYFGLKNGLQCFCGDAHPPTSLFRDTLQCFIQCSESSPEEKCGSQTLLSVYYTGIADIPVLGKKLGCFDHDGNWTLEADMKNSNSPSKCSSMCLANLFHYAGLENGSKCFCSNTLNSNTSRDLADSECNSPCTGDAYETCGAERKLSVYRTGLYGQDPEPVVKRVACVDESNHPLTGFRQDIPRHNTSKDCIAICHDNGFFFSLLLVRSQCWCGNEGPSNIQSLDEECGENQFAIYETGYPAIAQFQWKNYIGCFEEKRQKFVGFKQTFIDNLTTEKCSYLCFNKGFLYSGTMNSVYCLCSDTSPMDSLTKVREMECSFPCSGDNNKKCGGYESMRVYATGITDIPVTGKLMGCYFAKVWQRTLDGHKTDLEKTNTPRRCVNYCLVLGYMFAGMENHKECFCSYTRPNSTLKVPDRECDSVCAGDSSQTCGGRWHKEIYRTDFSYVTDVPVSSPHQNVSTPKPDKVCEPSQTVVNGKTVCRGAQVFYDNFQTSAISNHWQHIVKIAEAPDFEFVTFTSNSTNSFIRDGKLIIKPTLISDHDVKEGSIKLDGCTGLAGSRECELTAFSYNILPPVRSARLHTRNSFSFCYGIVEIRATLPAGDWIVPELWLLPKDQSYGANYLSGKITVAMSRGNRHLTYKGEDVGSSLLESGVLVGPDDKVTARSVPSQISGSWSSIPHTFTLIWTPDNLSFYVDGQSQRALLPPSGRLSELLGLKHSDVPTWYTGSRIAPFDTDFYLSLGLSVGGYRAFPDGCVSRNKEKPWRDFKLKAMLNFWLDKETWKSTWDEDRASLVIEYVKVTAL